MIRRQRALSLVAVNILGKAPNQRYGLQFQQTAEEAAVTLF